MIRAAFPAFILFCICLIAILTFKYGWEIETQTHQLSVSLRKKFYELKFKNAYYPLEILVEPSKGCQLVNSETAIFVLSSAEEYEQRLAVRRTWARNVPITFLLGLKNQTSENQMANLTKEQEEFDDLLIADYQDSYRNLSVKIFLMLSWALEHCTEATYIVKVDSDVLLSLSSLSSVIKTLANETRTSNTIACTCYEKNWVFREPDSKWYVSMEAYPEETYPRYCDGPGYLATADIIPKLLKASEGKHYFVDDALFTGVLAEEAKIERRCFDHFRKTPENTNFCDDFVVVHPLSGSAKLENFWKRYSECRK